VDNFGTTGEVPANQELLDCLALAFVKDGWSVKKLVRQMVLSKTYQQASAVTEAAFQIDPENKYFGRANRRRLEGENIRDAMLMLGQNLDPSRGGPGFAETLGSDYNQQSKSLRRSIYLPQFRNSMPELLELFDAADPSVVTGKRNTSTVPQQALYMLNHEFPKAQAKLAATEILKQKMTDRERIVLAYRAALGRAPRATEAEAIEKFLGDQKEPLLHWTMIYQALFSSPDFRYLD
jgi:hypothetical protein